MKSLLLLLASAVSAVAIADPGTRFSDLTPEQQQEIRANCKPPPLAQRQGPYSTPMYYLMAKGYEYNGHEDIGPSDRTYPKMNGRIGRDWGSWKLDRNRPDFQEAMLKDFAELGLNQTHLNLFPAQGNLVLDPDSSKAIQDFVLLSDKYGLRIGVRLDSIDETKLWSMHPNNPDNKRQQYLAWVKQVTSLLKGHTSYYVLGDELTLKQPAPDLPRDAWTPSMYLDYFKEVSGTIKQVDPAARVSMFGASSGEWFNVLWLLQNGYAQIGDGVAINHYDYKTVSHFFADRDRLAPGKLFLTNGVGYISNGTVRDRYPEGDYYAPQPTEDAHAAAIAKTMFMWWDLGADTAPYYISLRNWVVDGRIYPRWFGFFGFEDYVIDHDALTVRRYPGWYAYQAVACTFYDRDRMKPPSFDVDSDVQLSCFRTFEHQLGQRSELLLMLWSDEGEQTATVHLHSDVFGLPVRVSLKDMQQWESLDSDVTNGTTTIKLSVNSTPQIIRLVRR